MGHPEKPEKTGAEQPDLDHRITEHDNLQKSVTPDSDYMSDHNLCRVCHGVTRVCDKTDCPQK